LLFGRKWAIFINYSRLIQGEVPVDFYRNLWFWIGGGLGRKKTKDKDEENDEKRRRYNRWPFTRLRTNSGVVNSLSSNCQGKTS
jgi:hypothetical protein